MSKSQKILIQALRKEKTTRIPFWFMRQAGRYLPEYRALRSQTPDFLKFCYSPALAAEATLQPIERFGMDGAILFSDILVVPHALGMNVWFEEGKGPLLTPLEKIESLSLKKLNQLEPVYEALGRVKEKLPDDVALIGFAGAPWTLACYMIEGKSSKDFAQVKARAENGPEFFSKLIDILVQAVSIHIKNQIRAGAEVIQIFDSWAGLLDEKNYRQWAIAPMKEIVASVKSEFPDVPIIGFPRQSGIRFLEYAKNTGVDAVSVDDSVPLEWIESELAPYAIVQGCLSPEILVGDEKILIKESEKIISQLGDKAFVFNLGHGILPHTPLTNMQALCEFLKAA